MIISLHINNNITNQADIQANPSLLSSPTTHSPQLCFQVYSAPIPWPTINFHPKRTFMQFQYNSLNFQDPPPALTDWLKMEYGMAIGSKLVCIFRLLEIFISSIHAKELAILINYYIIDFGWRSRQTFYEYFRYIYLSSL